MITLFNKDDNGSQELQNLTGQWYASNPYSLVATEINFATNKVTSLIGEGTAKVIEEYYQAGTNDELVDAVRLPIACQAIMRYSALTSISHESTGRKVKVDDNEKSPYEWQIDRDDRAMRERYYRALDAMYTALDASGLDVWKDSSVKSAVASSIIGSIEDFEKVYPIDGSHYVYYMLQSLVIEYQVSTLAPYLGDNWESVVDKSASATLISLCQKAAVLGAVINAALRWSLEVFPLEIARRFSPTYQGNKSNRAATTDEIDWYTTKLQSQLNEALEDIAEEVNGGPGSWALTPTNDPRNKFFTTE